MCFNNQGRHAEGPPGDHQEPEPGRVRLLLEDGQGVRGAAGRRLQRCDFISAAFTVKALFLPLV